MRRSLRLVAATAWLLQLGACGDKPPARTPHLARPSRPSDGSDVAPHRAKNFGTGSGDPIEPAESATEIAHPASGRESRPSVSATSERLAERYGRARALLVQHGRASYYSDAFTGRRTASGAAYEPRGFTAAHRNLPFGTVLRVTRSDGGPSVYVRVTDRGPFGPRGRILDLSRAAAERLNMLRAGVVKIKIEVVEYGPPRKSRRRRR